MNHPQPRLQAVLTELPIGERHTHAVFAETDLINVQSVQHLPGQRADIPVALEFYNYKSFQRAHAPGGNIVETESGVYGETLGQ